MTVNTNRCQLSNQKAQIGTAAYSQIDIWVSLVFVSDAPDRLVSATTSLKELLRMPRFFYASFTTTWNDGVKGQLLQSSLQQNVFS